MPSLVIFTLNFTITPSFSDQIDLSALNYVNIDTAY